jgi:hypothetical protein
MVHEEPAEGEEVTLPLTPQKNLSPTFDTWSLVGMNLFWRSFFPVPLVSVSSCLLGDPESLQFGEGHTAYYD